MNDQLGTIARLVNNTLGQQALGTYLHGSVVQGGLRPASDIDILVVAEHSLTDRERYVLTNELLRISGAGPQTRSVELTAVVQSQVRPWRFPPVADFLYGDWLRDQIAAGGPPQPVPMTNLAVMIAQTLAGNRPLTGPPPDELLDAVPVHDLVRGSLAGIPDLINDLHGDSRNVVLTCLGSGPR